MTLQEAVKFGKRRYMETRDPVYREAYLLLLYAWLNRFEEMSLVVEDFAHLQLFAKKRV